jgi:hypothetical protein
LRQKKERAASLSINAARQIKSVIFLNPNLASKEIPFQQREKKEYIIKEKHDRFLRDQSWEALEWDDTERIFRHPPAFTNIQPFVKSPTDKQWDFYRYLFTVGSS